MKLLSTNTIAVPRDLTSITHGVPEREVDPESVGLARKDRDRIWQRVEDYYRTGISPALSVCVHYRGAVVLERALGYAQGVTPDGQTEPVKLARIDTPHCLFSASKAVTAMLVHKLAELHLIDLLAPVSHYLPAFGRHGKQYITIASVLSHRSGFPSLPKGQPLERFFDTDTIIQMLCDAEPESRSGHQVAYHAITGGYILGAVMQAVTGKTPHELMQSLICEPLGLSVFNYGLDPARADQRALHVATGFKPALGVDWFLQQLLGGNLDDLMSVTNDPRFLSVISPAANMYATAYDASRFFECLRQGGTLDGVEVFKPVTIQRATIEAGKPQFDRSLIAPIRYSHGLMLGSNPVGLYGPQTGKAYGHIGFSNVFCWADPARELSVSFLTSGKPLVGSHLPALGQLLMAFSKLPSVRS